jgi:ABC-type transport system involved in Fe-S cluster assembly fused permease/ATPase subunit
MRFLVNKIEGLVGLRINREKTCVLDTRTPAEIIAAADVRFDEGTAFRLAYRHRAALLSAVLAARRLLVITECFIEQDGEVSRL